MRPKYTSSSSSFILLGKQIQICSRGSNVAGTTRLKFSTNSRPKENITKKYNTKYEYETKTQKKIRTTLSTSAKNMTPVCREQLREIKKVTEINTFNCTLKCGESRKINASIL